MFTTLPRRKRRLLITAGLAALFVLLMVVGLWITRRPDPVYRPGQPIEGLASGLSRPLPDDHPRVQFTDVTEEAGIAFVHFRATRSTQLPEDMGSGAAWGDYDNDGWEDLYVVNFSGSLTGPAESVAHTPAYSMLYHNEGDGTFSERGESAGVRFRGRGMAAEWADYDNDGWPDLFVSAYGQNVLYRNLGDGSFTDVTRQAGLAGPEGFWAGVAWGDYDRDGDLDLYVTGYVEYEDIRDQAMATHYDVTEPASLNPSSFDPALNLLYRNDGDGTFTEVAARAGVAGARGRSLEATWTDFDSDGWPDLYVANDVSDNMLFRNLGNGAFEEISHSARVADYRGAMGIAVGDWDRDDDLDMVVTHWIAQENALYDNLSSQRRSGSGSPPPRLQFMDEADRFGLGQIALDYIGWATSFFDYDNDGWLDLFVVNGSTLQQEEHPQLLVPMADQLFWNRGPDQGFYDVSRVSGAYFERRRVGRGGAVADYDNDGDLDLFIVNHGTSAVLLRNDGGNRNHWLQVRLEGSESVRSGIGARLRLHTSDGVQTREVGAQASYLSQNSPVQHFGLEGLQNADSLVVTWPSGRRDVVRDVPVDQVLRLVEGEAEVALTEKQRVLGFWEAFREATDHRNAGRIEHAARAYTRALALDPTHEDALYYQGSMLLELGEFTEAERAWLRLLEVNPSSARAHSRLGVLYSCRTAGGGPELDRAEREFRQALRLNREETGPLLHLGQIALLRGHLAEADGYFDLVLGSNYTSVEAHYLKGYVAWRRRDGRAADSLFAAAVKLAAPPSATGGVPGEGDTRQGSRAMTTRARACRGVDAHLAAFRDRAADAPPPTPEQNYRELDRVLTELKG